MTVKIKNNLEEIKTQKLHSPPIPSPLAEAPTREGPGAVGGGRGIDKFRRDQSNTWKTHLLFWGLLWGRLWALAGLRLRAE